MEHPAIVRVDSGEETETYAVSRGEGLRRVWVNRSASLKLLGISLAARGLPSASARGICSALNHSVFNSYRNSLIGFLAVWGTSAAMKSLLYSALHSSRLYCTGHVGPGSLNLAAALFLATRFRLGRFLAITGIRGVVDELSKLETAEGVHYIGLKSLTKCPVGNAIGQYIVQEHKSLWAESKETDVEKGWRNLHGSVGRQAGRKCKVIVLKVEGSKKPTYVSIKCSTRSALFFGWLPLALTIVVIVSCSVCKLWAVFALISGGMLGSFVAALVLRHIYHYKYSEPEVAESSPPGDILVVNDKEPDVLHIVKADEATIQKLFQRKVVFESLSGDYLGSLLLFFAAVMLYGYGVVSVFSMPFLGTSSQIHFVVANVIGLLADVCKGSRNGKLAMATKACETFGVVLCGEPIVFGNRTAAVAFVAAHSNEPLLLKSERLIPVDGPTWREWWNILGTACGEGEADFDTGEDLLLATLVRDMQDGLVEFRSQQINYI